MKKQMRFLIWIAAAVILTAAGIFLYRYFVTDRVTDKGGMVCDWQADMQGQWTGISEGYENCSLEITDSKAAIVNDGQVLYNGTYTADEDNEYLVLDGSENPPFKRIEIKEQNLAVIAEDDTEILFEKKTDQ